MTDKLHLTDAQWRERLTPEQYHMLREAGTERAFTGKYEQNKAAGTYLCAGCGTPLFSSETKYNSGSGWPSYTAPLDDGAVEERRDVSHGMIRTEVRCAKCGSHMGHVFEGEGYDVPTDQRWCINSVSLVLEPR